MRTFLVMLVTAIALLSGTPREAEAQCLVCGIVGFAIGSSGGDSHVSAPSPGTIYVAPRLFERIGDPLDVRFAVSQNHVFSRGHDLEFRSLREMFAHAVPDASKYTVIEIIRFVDPEDNTRARFWFAYIESDRLKPLSDLPSQ